jgi:hypothetical protein
MKGRIIIPIIALLAAFIVGLFSVSDILIAKRKEEFSRKSYSGIVDSVRYSQLNRGAPSIYMNHRWVTLSIDEMSMAQKIQVGDSLVKQKNTTVIYCYRRDTTGVLHLIIFE